MKFLLCCVFVYVLFGISYFCMNKDINAKIAIFIIATIFIIAICLTIFGVYGFVKSVESSKQPTQKAEVIETQQSEKETRKTQERKLRKLVASGKADIFIDGEPTSDDFDLDGIRLKDCKIKFKNRKVYLISY